MAPSSKFFHCSLLTIAFMVGSAFRLPPPAISGPSPAAIGVTLEYSYPSETIMDDIWDTAGAGTVVSAWHVGTKYYASIQWTTLGAQTLKIYDGIFLKSTKSVSVIPAAPTPTSGSRCGTGTVALSATAGSGGSSVRWYTALTGGTLLTTGTSYTTPSISTTTTYYIESWNSSLSLASSPRTAITATVNTVPGSATASGTLLCKPGISSLSATPGSNGTTCRWYTASSGGTLLTTATSYTTPTLSATTSYYVATYNATTGCESSSRTQVTVTYAPASAPTSVTHGQSCNQQSVTISATPVSPANSIVWYPSPAGNDSLYIGTSYSTPAHVKNAVYYAASYNTTTGCISASRTPVTAKADLKPKPEAVWAESDILGSGTTKMFANTSTGVPDVNLVSLPIDTAVTEVNWYATRANAKTNTSRIYKGLPFTTPNLTTTTEYHVRLRDKASNCWADTSAVAKGTATVIPFITSASVQTEVLRVTGKKTESSLSTLTDAEKTTGIVYMDGIGRVRQSVVLRGSPTGYDVVTPVEFDQWGRSSKNYLPYVATTTNGSFHSAYQAEQQNFYQATNDKVADDAAPYAVTVYDDTPLGLVKEQGSVGTSWQPGTAHTQRADYLFNNSTDQVRKFDSKGNSSGFYAAKTLRKVKSTDAQGNHVLTFTDGSGNTVLVRQWIDATVEGTYTEYLETYTLYNDNGQPTFIISPKGTAVLKAGSWSFTQSIKDNYCNQFVYDALSRVIEKKVPGQAWQYMVYDPLGRVVLTQDAMLRTTNQWAFVKYDYEGRTVMTGLYTNTTQTTRATMQTLANGLYTSSNGSFGENAWYEKKGATAHGYTNVSFPNTNTDVLAVSYYDNHDFDFNGSDDRAYVVDTLSNEHTPTSFNRGRATGSKRKILNTSTWLYTYVFYDDRGRAIQVQSNNHLNTTVADRTTNVYADDGRTLYSKKYHNAGTGKVTRVLNSFDYNTDGRLWKVHQKNNNGTTQLVAQYEYNALGQMVDKKLHNTGGSNFLQSVDYRYTIRGQLASINNGQLAVDNSNDDSNDYFGMDFMYEQVESGLSNAALFNGNISAVKWKAAGASSGSTDQKSYKFGYDKTGKLQTATYQMKGPSTWTKEANAQNEAMTYDHNGNIKTLQRNQRKHQLSGVTASYTNEAIDNLTYTYNSSNGNSLDKVTDAALTTGFNNGTSSTNNDFTYDTNGNLLSDKNKGMDSIKYNFMGKVSRIKFSDGKVITYKYDAAGSKLSMSVTVSGTTTTTDYVNSFVYEGGNLSFFGSPEGRVVKNGSALEYQYSIADHQGNTRVVFSSNTPTPDSKTANMETAPNTDFLNSTANRTNWELFDHTDATTDATDYSQKLMPGQAGIAKTYKVYPGDKIKIEAYAKYYNASSTTANITGFATALLSAFNLSAPAGGETGTAASGVNGWGSVVAGGGGNGNTSFPKAFVNLLVFDKNYNFLDLTFEQINGGEQVGVTPKAAHDYMSREYTVKEEGYIYAYLSNENTTQVEVYFDDVVITQTKTNIVQYNEYYPFGLQTSTSWTREGSDNDFLYNAGNELNANNGWYEMHYRGYDPATGRMLQVDPYATLYSNHTTYNYALNNPVMINDPSGGQAAAPPGVSETGWRRQQKISEMSESGNYYANWDENFSAIEGEGSGSWMLAKYYSVYQFDGFESGPISGSTYFQWEWVEDETQGEDPTAMAGRFSAGFDYNMLSEGTSWQIDTKRQYTDKNHPLAIPSMYNGVTKTGNVDPKSKVIVWVTPDIYSYTPDEQRILFGHEWNHLDDLRRSRYKDWDAAFGIWGAKNLSEFHAYRWSRAQMDHDPTLYHETWDSAVNGMKEASGILFGLGIPYRDFNRF